MYTLLDKLDRVAYVGQTRDLPKRLQQHATNKQFVWWYAFGATDWREGETGQIRRCRPYLYADGSERRSPWSARVIHRADVLAGER